MGIQTNEKITNLILEKYGEFNPENMKKYFLEEFFVGSSGRKIDEQDYESILIQMEKLTKAQGISLDDIEYLGFGQMYSTFGVGDAVIKIGNTTENVYENPFRLVPVYKQNLKPNLGLYVSQRARTTGVPERATKEMYNLIRDAGGLWLDIKAENLGYVDSKMDFSSIYPERVANNRFDREFSEYNGNLFVIDYEDIIFLEPSLKEKMLNGEAYNINSVPRELLLGSHSNDEIYFDGFIKNSNKLLEYEMEYQRGKGNLSAASKCFSTYLKNEREIKQHRYVDEQRYRFDRNFSDIGNRFSIKEIAMQIMQKTNMTRLDKIIEFINTKKRARRERALKPTDQISEEIVQETESGLVLEEINVGEFRDLEDPYTTENANDRMIATSKRNLEDPYTTR